MRVQTHYEVLGLHPSATSDVVEAVYRALAKKHHPDKGGDKSTMARINEAHAVLSDPKKRRAYDRTMGSPNGSGQRHEQRHTEGFPNVADFMRGAANGYPNAYPFTDETIQQEIAASGARIAQLMVDRMVENMPVELAMLLKNAILRGGGR